MKSFNIGDLRIPIPIIQGGMGIGISLSGLATAVANMGGIGVISSVGIGLIEKSHTKNLKIRHIEAMRREIRKFRRQSDGVLGVNIMTVITNFADMVRTSIEEGVDIIFSGAGLPLDLPKYLTGESRTKLVPIVSSGRAASIISTKWQTNYGYLPDAFVVEGPKAGGHLGFKAAEIEDVRHNLETLVSQVLEVTAKIREKYRKSIPVIAAGGIYTGKDMYRIMKMGASAVQIGTRFIATEECDAAPAFKKALTQAKSSDVRIIKSPVGLPGRTIYNQFLSDAEAGRQRPEVCMYHCIKTCDPKTTTYCITSALLEASRGNLSKGFAFTGSNAGKVRRISTVREIFIELISEYQQTKNQE